MQMWVTRSAILIFLDAVHGICSDKPRLSQTRLILTNLQLYLYEPQPPPLLEQKNDTMPSDTILIPWPVKLK